MEQHFAEARRLFLSGDLPGADTLFRLIISGGDAPEMVALALAHRAGIRHQMQDLPGAIALAEEALRTDPNCGAGHAALSGMLLNVPGAGERAVLHCLAAARLLPDEPLPIVNAHLMLLKLCRWREAAALEPLVRSLAARTPVHLTPQHALMMELDTAELLRSARAASEVAAQRAGVPAEGRPLPPAPSRPDRARLRIGYLSADFRAHATAHLFARMVELHDRSRFEIRCYALCPSDGSPIRRRLEAAAPVIDVGTLAAAAVAERIRADDIDILVDLHGHCLGGRLGVLARRPAPVQVTYLGFAGTVGAAYIDYLIADPIVAPIGSESAFSEKLIRVGCYQCNDDRPDVAPIPEPRAAHGLPEGAAVYVSFNQYVKITRSVFDLWCRILRAVPESVLWLMEPPTTQTWDRLLAAARDAGVAPTRLVFAPKRPHDQHLARLAHADILLDTRPCNSHTTASDALWMGVPLVTWPTACFQGRVAASLLCAVGLPDLVADGADAYVGRAVELGRNEAQRRTLRHHLLTAGRVSRLFDAATHARELETAYLHMAERARRGLPAAPLDLA